MANDIKTREGKNYKAAHFGSFMDESFGEYNEYHPKLEAKVDGRVFLKKILGLTCGEISINRFEPGEDVPLYHHHKNNEEVYIFLKGKGQFQVDDDIFDVEEGSIVRVSTPGRRVWRAAPDHELYFMVIQAKEGSSLSDEFNDGVLHFDETVEW